MKALTQIQIDNTREQWGLNGSNEERERAVVRDGIVYRTGDVWFRHPDGPVKVYCVAHWEAIYTIPNDFQVEKPIFTSTVTYLDEPLV